MPSNHLILCRPLLLLPSLFPIIRVFSNESVLLFRWPKYWSFSFSISPSNEYSGLISFRMDWLDFLAVQGTLKSLLQHPSSKALILQPSAFFIVQLSHPYMAIGKTIALTRWTFVGKVMSLLFNTESCGLVQTWSLMNWIQWTHFLGDQGCCSQTCQWACLPARSFQPINLQIGSESNFILGKGKAGEWSLGPGTCLPLQSACSLISSVDYPYRLIRLQGHRSPQLKASQECFLGWSSIWGVNHWNPVELGHTGQAELPHSGWKAWLHFLWALRLPNA